MKKEYKSITKQLIMVTFLTVIFSGFVCSWCSAQTEQWMSLKGKRVVIQYKSEQDLIKFAERLNTTKEVLLMVVDNYLNSTQSILGMYRLSKGIKIKIYTYQYETDKAWEQTGAKGKPPIAFYVHKIRTIYMSCQNARIGVLVHEMAHAIIRSYFVVKVPRETSEILARYVERKFSEL